MNATFPFALYGAGVVRPYVYAHYDTRELVKSAFGAEELEVNEHPRGGVHLEAKIGDSYLVLELGDSFPPDATPASIYIYVADTDAAYERALAAGATSYSPPGDKPYNERSAGVRDSFGNTWWISTYLG
jgi:PhnB protein